MKLLKMTGVAILMYGSFLAGESYHNLTQRVAIEDKGRADCIEDVNLLLKSQGYSLKFRIGEHGTALVFPGPSRKSVYDRWLLSQEVE
jgi:hypothetical protein